VPRISPAKQEERKNKKKGKGKKGSTLFACPVIA